MNQVTPEQQTQITSLLNQFVAYWNQKDAGKMASLFREDAEFTDIMGQIALGRAKIDAMHQFVFQRFMKEAVLSQEILYIRPVAPQHVMATCKWQTEGHTDPNGKSLPARTGLMQVILSEEAGEWQISLVHNFDFTAMYNQAENYKMTIFEPQPPK